MDLKMNAWHDVPPSTFIEILLQGGCSSSLAAISLGGIR